MICPLKPHAYDPYTCDKEQCAWWDSKANLNPETKQFEGQCCILTLAQLKIKGGISTHPY